MLARLLEQDMEAVVSGEHADARTDVTIKIEALDEDEAPTDEETAGPSIESDLGDVVTCEERVSLPLDERDATRHPDCDLLRCVHCHADLPPSLLSPHMVAAHGYRLVRYKCATCEATFADRAELALHRTHRHRPPLVSCDICQARVQSNYISKHISKVHSVRDTSERCETCGKMLKSRETLQQHIKSVHAVEQESDCSLCGQTFKSYKYLLNHVRNVHPTPDKANACKHCGKVFKSRMCLHQHTKNVHAPRAAAAPCPSCSKIFKTKANLAQHVRHVHPETLRASRESRASRAAATTATPVPLADLPRQLLDQVGLSSLYGAVG